MPSPSTGSSNEAAGNSKLKWVVRKLAPWYGGAVTVYATVRIIYGWIHGAGLLKIPLQDLIFNLCQMAGLAALAALMLGGPLALMGIFIATVGGLLLEGLGLKIDPDLFFKRAFWLFAILGGGTFGAWMLIGLASDPHSFTDAPRYDGTGWFLAALGAAVLVATYVFFGKKLLDRWKTLKAALEENA